MKMGARASKPSSFVGGSSKRRLGHPRMTPRGYVPVCVGVNNDTRRFIVHRTALDDAEFSELLCKSAEEYGFCNQGILRIPSEAKDFEDWVLRRAKGKVFRVKQI